MVEEHSSITQTKERSEEEMGKIFFYPHKSYEHLENHKVNESIYFQGDF